MNTSVPRNIRNRQRKWEREREKHEQKGLVECIRNESNFDNDTYVYMDRYLLLLSADLFLSLALNLLS